MNSKTFGQQFLFFRLLNYRSEKFRYFVLIRWKCLKQFRSHVLNLYQRRSGINLITPDTSAHGQRGTVEDSTFFSIMSAVKRAHFSAEIRNGRNLRLVLIAVSINPGLITVTAILYSVR